MVRYRHRQVGYLLVGGLLLAALAGLIRLRGAGNRAGHLLRNVILPLALAGLMGTLTTSVQDGRLRVAFGPGLIRRTVPLDEIRDVRATNVPWYAGTGIRWLPWTGWIFNVARGGAVEVRLRDGGRFRIGTDEPERLRNAIQEGRNAP